MDAKVDGWVVTPRRGKAVEINALWYNALRLLEQWTAQESGVRSQKSEVRSQKSEMSGGMTPEILAGHAERARSAFNERFWYAPGGYLYDVVDGEEGDDSACR